MQFSEERKWQRNKVTNWKLELFEYLRSSPFLHVLMPGRYVGTEEEEDDGIPFDVKTKSLTTKLAEQFARGSELEKSIRENLKGIGYEF
jgi:type I restriction enzyme M protein